MKKLIANVIPEETRLAIMSSEGELLEYTIERPNASTIVGAVYKGRVQRVLPGMQAAFVDIGQSKNAFLYLGENNEKGNKITEGQEIMVQISKDGFGDKGPKAATQIILPGRYLALSPMMNRVGLSRRIEDLCERERLKGIGEKIRVKNIGVIIRTVAEGASEADLRADFNLLEETWQQLQNRYVHSKAPTLLYRDLELSVRMVRDYCTSDVNEVIVDNPKAYNRIKELLIRQTQVPSESLRLYSGSEPIFAHFKLREQLKKLYQRKVDLLSGGSISIDHTEALTAIDVNTARFIGKSHLSDTTMITNLEAVDEIVRQLRLRDVSGMIIIDFIDMQENQREEIINRFKEKAKIDRTRVHVAGFTQLGLLEVTRKKVRKDLRGLLQSDCFLCNGRGSLFTPESVAISAVRELRRRKDNLGNREIIIQIHPVVAQFFKDSGWIKRIEEELSIKMEVESNSHLRPDIYTLLAGS